MATTVRSRITSKSQTTVPTAVRQALRVGPGDELDYVIENDRVILLKAKEERDPVLLRFLDFIERDMMARPETIVPFPRELHREMISLTEGDDIDLDARIEGDLAG